MQAADEPQARAADDLHVLQIALGPSAVANGDVDQRGRRFLPGAPAIGGHAHLPAPAAHQCGLDEIMRQHKAAEWLAALELRQAAILRERSNANNGVVPPVIAAVAGPCRQPAGDDRAVDAGCELLQPGKQGLRADELRRGLQDPERGVRTHRQHQALQSGRVDQAVGIEHDHVVVAGAPAADEFLEIAGFTGDIEPAPPIPDRHDVPKQARNLATLKVSRIHASALVESERITISKPPCAWMLLQRFAHRLQGRRGAGRVLVVDRHHECGKRGRAVYGVGTGSRRLDAPASTEPAANAIQPNETAKKKIIVPCRKVMLAKRTTCSI